jgi:hypothetical protein
MILSCIFYYYIIILLKFLKLFNYSKGIYEFYEVMQTLSKDQLSNLI